ncbi:MAG: glutamate racemase, partial [Desulfuromonadales bacterium]
DKGIDTLVLGCTHYPLLKKTLQEVVGAEVQLVDSAQETAKSVKLRLEQDRLLQSAATAQPPCYYVTDIPDRFLRVGGAFLGEELRDVKTVVLD